MNALFISRMRHELAILVGSQRIAALCGNIIEGFAMLALVASDHIYGLLEQIEIEILLGSLDVIAKIAINEVLGTGIEKSVYITLVPATLLDRLKFGVEIIEPLTDVTLVWLKCIIPRGIVE